MNINTYIENCVQNPKFPTYYTLEMGPANALLTRMKALRDQSETGGIECGFRLGFNDQDELVPGPDIVGTEDRLALNSAIWKLSADYIGDCHTHPYLRKMGADAEIGPSSGDYMEWWTHPPSGFQGRIAVHFVISNTKVFLIISRVKVATNLVASKKTESDVLKRYTNANDELMMAAYDDYRGKTLDFKLAARKAAWDRYAPKAAKEFAAENLAYNLDMARLLRFEFYTGRLGTGSTPCKLGLKSSKLYGSCCDYFTQAWAP